MKNRNEKQQDLDKLKTELAKVSTVILSTFQGITVKDDTKLRRAVQAAGGKYKVVKNTRALREGILNNLVLSTSGLHGAAEFGVVFDRDALKGRENDRRNFRKLGLELVQVLLL